MPIKECQLEGKNGYKWGDAGKCYIHNDTAGSKKQTRKKALEQGLATGDIKFINEDDKRIRKIT